MFGLKRLIFTFGVSAILTGCAGMDMKQAEQVEPQGSPFAKGLFKEYLQHASLERGRGDTDDANAFAHRAMVAAGGKEFLPAPVLRDNLPKGSAAPLTRARSRLMAGLEAGARSKAPAQAARAQVMFDCWLHKQEFNADSPGVDQCRRGFMTSLASAEAVLEKERKEAEARRKVSRKFVVYFGFNSARMNADALRIIGEAAAFAKKIGAKNIKVSGFSDRAGSARYNLGLSEKRTQAVGATFGDQGVASDLISVTAFGEQSPAIETNDGKSEWRNRRVEIIVSS